MRIGLVPDSALQFHILGILTVTCLRGDKIPDGAKEGVRLNLEGALLPPLLTGGGFRKDVWGKPLNFNKEIAGLTVFVAI